ncbi:unnamed protein product, partial [Heterosigma akashiwo]
CNVCGDSVSYEDNCILFCDKCNVPVHQFCYGLSNLPEADEDWYCQVCASGSASAARERCCVCGRPGGAFKRTVDGAWCHVACALWVPELRILDDLALEGIDTSTLDPERRTLKCLFCKDKKGGACIQCAHERCYAAFHPPCLL